MKTVFTLSAIFLVLGLALIALLPVLGAVTLEQAMGIGIKFTMTVFILAIAAALIALLTKERTNTES
ncbi:hypothetical protein [Thalassotalea agarivorans]|uniref:Uncharacterized protein n=1 Tax=Thalassotalea agarivorans TaxID=349064 RepID=A0A1I0FYQ2_THASX|nr:hypothetical protein [Thalassotalea agarivorans]SET63410.1 hypothetical protein SAMN05660429_02281 [Thalassotalea agarivorans]